MDTKPVKPLLVIVGETASGKSMVAMDLARRFRGEIICADSWTVRRGVDIGTSKPTQKDQDEIPHHLLDVVGPNDEFTAAVFKDLAKSAIDGIYSRNKLPIVVGGTGLYVDALLYDYQFLPEGDRKERAALNKKTLPELLKIINDNQISIENLDIRNKRRLIRAIETDGQVAQKSKIRANTLIVGTKTDIDQLNTNIHRRVNVMIEQGLEKEVVHLYIKYGWDCEALKGIGYKEWQDYFLGTQSLDDTKAKIVNSTKNLAKRQRTWFKRNKSIQWLNEQSKIVDIVTTFLNKTKV